MEKLVADSTSSAINTDLIHSRIVGAAVEPINGIVQIHEQVNTSIFKGTHATTMILSRVDMVNSYCIGAQTLHECCVQLALIGVKEGICW